MADLIVGLSSFNNADNLVEYISFRRKTQRALVLYSHLVQLAYLAGFDISNISKKEMSQKNKYVSLYDYDTEKLLVLAKERLKKGIIPKNWKELFVLIFKNQ